MIYQVKPEIEALRMCSEQIASMKMFLRGINTPEKSQVTSAMEYLDLAGEKLKKYMTSRWLELDEAERWPPTKTVDDECGGVQVVKADNEGQE